MYLEISNPMDYHVALYIRLSKEDESEGPSRVSRTRNLCCGSLFNSTGCPSLTLMWMTDGAAPVLTVPVSSG